MYTELQYKKGKKLVHLLSGTYYIGLLYYLKDKINTPFHCMYPLQIKVSVIAQVFIRQQ